jgi:hypothetical protein
MTRMSASLVMTVPPPGHSSLASIAIKRRVLWIHSSSGELQDSTVITFGNRATSRCAAGLNGPTSAQRGVESDRREVACLETGLHDNRRETGQAPCDGT